LCDALNDLDPATQAERVNTARTNRFELTDTTVALYGTYQWRIDSKWGVLGGLRAEYTDLDMNQVTTGQRATNHYFDAIPSAFVTYGLSDDTTLRLNYAHRIRRPGAGDLNPFVVYLDEFNVSSGNPDLRPSDSDSLELGVETKLGKVDTNLRLYARRDTDLINERRIFIANNVLLTTKEKFDAVTSDPLDPWVKGAATLYTKEFFDVVKAHLNPGGVVTLFVQLYESSDAAVTSEVSIAQPGKIDLGRTISSEELHNLPLPSRNPYNFAFLQANVTGYETNEFAVPRINANASTMHTISRLDGHTLLLRRVLFTDGDGELPHAQDVGRALGHAHAAARVEQVEQVRALQAVLKGRQAQAALEQLFTKLVVLIELPAMERREPVRANAGALV